MLHNIKYHNYRQFISSLTYILYKNKHTILHCQSLQTQRNRDLKSSRSNQKKSTLSSEPFVSKRLTIPHRRICESLAIILVLEPPNEQLIEPRKRFILTVNLRIDSVYPDRGTCMLSFCTLCSQVNCKSSGLKVAFVF